MKIYLYKKEECNKELTGGLFLHNLLYYGGAITLKENHIAIGVENNPYSGEMFQSDKKIDFSNFLSLHVLLDVHISTHVYNGFQISITKDIIPTWSSTANLDHYIKTLSINSDTTEQSNIILNNQHLIMDLQNTETGYVGFGQLGGCSRIKQIYFDTKIGSSILNHQIKEVIKNNKLLKQCCIFYGGDEN